MNKQITQHPLCWPDGVNRTPVYSRKSGHIFVKATVKGAYASIFKELRLFGIPANKITVSTDVSIALTGKSAWKDPGVAVWFERGGVVRVIAVDAFDTPQANMRAIALAIDSIRRLERYKCASIISEATHALVDAPALPQKAGDGMPQWFETLRVDKDAPIEVAEAAYRTLSKSAHPDAGGSRERFEHLQWAIETARSQVTPQK